MTDSGNEDFGQETGGTGHSLAEMLRAARLARGLELSDLARLTSVRSDYLDALENDRHADLPESVYVRNFVKLFAQAVGLDSRAALELYMAEYHGRQDAPEVGVATRVAPPAARQRAGHTAGSEVASSGRGRRRDGPAFGSWLPSLLLVAVVVGLAVWGFNSALFRPGQAPSGPTVAQNGTSGGEEETPLPPGVGTSRLSVSTEPSGARVLVDAFPLEGTTPIADAPVTALPNRVVRVELEGYQPFEAEFDLSFNRNLSFVLSEAALLPEEDDDDAGGVIGAPGGQEVAGDGMIQLDITDLTWLEVYSGTARSGTPLVYTTAAAGQSYQFDLPVYVHVGNAAGVAVSVSGRNLGSLGSAGQVMGRSFTEAD